MDTVSAVTPPPDVTEEQPEIVTRKKGLKALVKPQYLVLVGAFGMALLMWAFNFQPVSSESTKLSAPYLPTLGNTFLNLDSPVWNDSSNLGGNKVEAAVVPLSGQFFIKEYGGSINQVRAKAAHDGQKFAVWVQWQDSNKNVTGDSADQSKSFSDAVAVEFPLNLQPGHSAFRCMGQQGAEVNIWQWKAERDADQTRPLGFEPIRSNGAAKAAKNWVGPNAAYLIDPGRFDPDSKSYYDPTTKTWTVIFERQIKSDDLKSAAQLAGVRAGDEFGTQIAFAVWDGGNGEKLSKKAVSSWVDLTLARGDTGPQLVSDLTNLGIWAALLLGSIAVAWRFLPAGNRGNK